MSNAKFTLFGCEKYFITQNQSLFDNLNVPSGITKSTLIDNIMLRGGEFEVQYGDPDFLRAAIGSWSNKWMPTMQRWVNALAIEYNPLENYDRIEDWTDNIARSDAMTHTGSSNRSGAKSSGASHSESASENIADERSEASNNTQSGSTSESANYSQSDAKQSAGTNNVNNTFDRDKWNSPPKHTTTKSAYDSNSYEPYMQETDTGKWLESSEGSTTSNESAASSSNSSGSTTNSQSGSSSNASSGTSAKTASASSTDGANSSEAEDITTKNDSSSAMNNDSVHSGRIHGNIGVTTSQQMLQQELDIGYWNIYEKVTELFLQEFTIPVYL